MTRIKESRAMLQANHSPVRRLMIGGAVPVLLLALFTTPELLGQRGQRGGSGWRWRAAASGSSVRQSRVQSSGLSVNRGAVELPAARSPSADRA